MVMRMRKMIGILIVAGLVLTTMIFSACSAEDGEDITGDDVKVTHEDDEGDETGICHGGAGVIAICTFAAIKLFRRRR